MRVVLDTNVFIAAALKGGLASDIIDMAASTTLLQIVASQEILTEIRDKLLKKFHWQESDIALFIKQALEVAEIVEVTEKLSVITRDPEDNKILECAVAGNADLIVSADQDLIKLKSFRGIAIVHPKTLSWTFLHYFQKKKK